jgi:5'-phosphate synthase pdxT subunit
MKIAVLALQGAFIEHEQVLQRLGVETVEIRQLRDWQAGPYDGWCCLVARARCRCAC